MAHDDSFKRWKSTRKSVRESLGLKKRSDSKDKIEQAQDSTLRQLFDDYDSAASNTLSERKIAKVRDRVLAGNFQSFKDSDIIYALNSQFADGDSDRAFELLDLVENSYAGRLHPYDPQVKLLGADNNNGVTCYLDSTLFAMFSLQTDFEAMLYHTFDDPHKKRLVILLRLWVNMLRSGRFIDTNFMAQLQSALAACGWQEAGLKQQQDASEAFNFITDVLDLPRLTLKKDMYHQGKADQDDHKYTNERTIDVALPEWKEGKTITLEECMLDYFDDRVVVERQRDITGRRNTIGSGPAHSYKEAEANLEKQNPALHVEVAELSGSNPATPVDKPPPAYDGRPNLLACGRTSSIFEDKKVDVEDHMLSPTRKNSLSLSARKRSTTIGKMVKMPAFQFFRLIPWYTEGSPNSDLQVAQHFEDKRPTVGICLKRFGQRSDGTFYKRSDKIDIPLDFGIPEFLHDDEFSEERFPNYKFKLSLQSIICHRGDSIQRGHYVSYVRAMRPRGLAPMAGSRALFNSNANQDPWLRFDDLDSQKVQYVDIKQVLEEECPYMLFYKIDLRGGDDNPGRVSMEGRPPSYTEDAGPNGMAADKLQRVPHYDGAASSSDLHREYSHTSSAMSSTSSPPVAVIDSLATPAHGVPNVVEPRSESIAVSGKHSVTPLEIAHVGDRSSSVPSGQAAVPVTTNPTGTCETTTDDTVPKARSSTNGSGGGSMGRSLSTIFKPRSGSKGRNGGSNSRQSLDMTSLLQPKTSTFDNTQTAPLANTENAATDTSMTDVATTEEGNDKSGPIPSNGLDHSSRKIIDERRSGRSKDKGAHRRERSLGERLRVGGDKSDRECSIM